MVKVAVWDFAEIATRDGQCFSAGVDTVQLGHARGHEPCPASTPAAQVEATRTFGDSVPGENGKVGCEQSRQLGWIEARLIELRPLPPEVANHARIKIGASFMHL